MNLAYINIKEKKLHFNDILHGIVVLFYGTQQIKNIFGLSLGLQVASERLIKNVKVEVDHLRL